MKDNNLEHIDRLSADGVQLNLDALYRIAPSVFTEAVDPQTGRVRRAVDFEALRELLGDNACDGGEMYQFTWVGKRAARAEAARPTDKTLRPVPEDSVDWDSTKNIYIEGDNLEVLKLLQRSYMGRVKMIYIDPPYNTGNDFVYHDDFRRSASEEDLEAGNVDELGKRFRRNTDSNGKFHSDWCSMIYSRLLVARSLLTEDGVIFISIDDNEVENLRKICDEVFGEGNFVYELSVVNNLNGNDNSSGMMETQEYCLIYSKNKDAFIMGVLPLEEEEANDWYQDELGYWKVGRCLKATGINAPREARPNLFFPIFINEETCDFTVDEEEAGADWYHLIPLTEGREMRWYWSKETFRRDKNEVIVRKTTEGYSLYKKQRPALGDLPSKRGKTTFYSPKYANANSNAEIKQLFDGRKIFDYTKSTQLIKDFLSLGVIDNDALILDFFSGSATTAHAVMQLNAEDGGHRRYIMVQLPEETAEDSEAYKAGYANICEIGKERIRRAGAKIKEGLDAKAAAAGGDLFSGEEEGSGGLDAGFRVFRLDESNFEDVSLSPGDYDQGRLDIFADNIKSDRSELDLLFGAMLAWGVTLDLPMRTVTVDGCNIYIVNGGDLVACFSENITDDVVREMTAQKPLRVLFRDSCFDADDKKINIYEQFKQALDWSDTEAMGKIKVI